MKIFHSLLKIFSCSNAEHFDINSHFSTFLKQIPKDVQNVFRFRRHNQCLGFSSTQGRHLRYLTVVCRHPSYTTCKRFQRTMTSFLAHLYGKAKLQTFHINFMEFDRFWRYDKLTKNLITSLTRFLKGQKRLRVFEMANAQLSLTHGCRVLDSLGYGNGDTLEEFDMSDFFHSRLAVFRDERYAAAMSWFTSLTKLSMNYNCLSDDILEMLCTNCANRYIRFSCFWSFCCWNHNIQNHPSAINFWRIKSVLIKKNPVLKYCRVIGKNPRLRYHSLIMLMYFCLFVWYLKRICLTVGNCKLSNLN